MACVSSLIEQQLLLFRIIPENDLNHKIKAINLKIENFHKKKKKAWCFSLKKVSFFRLFAVTILSQIG